MAKRKPSPSPVHTDGSPCLEGTRRVPRGFRPCCAAFAARTTACEFDVRFEWWSRQKTWVICISSGAGGGGIALGHCPFCGRRLPGDAAGERLLRV